LLFLLQSEPENDSCGWLAVVAPLLHLADDAARPKIAILSHTSATAPLFPAGVTLSVEIIRQLNTHPPIWIESAISRRESCLKSERPGKGEIFAWTLSNGSYLVNYSRYE
jgi:hypothetical protein